jgi:hypothetical protein
VTNFAPLWTTVTAKTFFQPTRCIIYAIELLLLLPIRTAQCSTNFQPTLFCHMLGVTIKGSSLVQSKYVILIQLNFRFYTICIGHYGVVSVRPFAYLSPWQNSETAERIQTSSTITLKSVWWKNYSTISWDAYTLHNPFRTIIWSIFRDREVTHTKLWIRMLSYRRQ